MNHLKTNPMKQLFTFCLSVSLLMAATTAQALDFVVSGAGNTSVNGTYVENGSYNGKPKYEHETENFVLVWDCNMACSGWHIFIDYGGFYGSPQYYSPDAGDTPPSTGWVVGFTSSPAPSVQPASQLISYGGSLFLESSDNDGSIIGSGITITHNGFGGNTFAGVNGEDFAATGKAIFSNVPAGLTPNMVRVSATELTFSLQGNATSHLTTDDVVNLAVQFQDAAFTSGNAVAVVNYMKVDFQVEFITKLTVASSGADHTTIAAAVAAADHFDEILISGETFTESNISFTKSLTFRGSGADVTIIQAAATPNSGGGKVFNLVNGSGIVSLKFFDLTIQNGDHTSSSGIHISSNTLETFEMHRCAVRNCSAAYGSSGAYASGLNASAYAGEPTWLLKDCEFSGNSSVTDGVQARGGAISLNGSENTLIVENCTFSNNSVDGGSANPIEGGGAIYVENSTLSVRNSTFTNNTSSNRGGAIFVQSSDCDLENVIAYSNTAAVGTDLFRSNFSTVNAINCIIGSTDPEGGDGEPGINGTDTNVSSADPLLQGLADNGGTTQTHALGAGSPAIDAGTSATSYDQRGLYRKGTRDIGAYEYEGITNLWNGDVSTGWNTDSNWTDGSAPTATDDIVIAAGTFQPVIVGTPGAPTVCADLEIELGATLIIAAGKAMTVTGSLVNNGTILIEADASGIGSLITEGSVSGAGVFGMQQYLTGSGGATPNGVFYYVGSPVAGATAANYGVASGNKLWSADESAQTYPQVTDGATVLNANQGYVVRMGSTGAITLTGTAFHSGNQSAAGLTRTGTVAANRGYNLVSNPYPSTVSWDDATRSNLEPTLWYRTHQGSAMLYDTYNATAMVGTNNNGSGAVTGNIAPTQAFWVRVDADGTTGQLDFSNAMRSHGSLAGIYRLASEEGVLRMNLSNGVHSDETILLFDMNAMDHYDAFDSQKFWASNAIPQLYTALAPDTLVINGMQSTATNPVVDLGMKLPSAGTYTLHATDITLPNESVFLEDRELNVFQDLNSDPVYSFTALAGGNLPTRFAIHFGMSVTDVAEQEGAGSRVFTTNGNQLNVALTDMAATGRVQVMDVAGKMVDAFALTGPSAIFELNATAGIYFVRVESNGKMDTHKVILQ